MKRAVLTGVLTLLFSGLLAGQSPNGSGRVAFGSYFKADVDTINLYNGNVMLDIPLFELQGRELSTGLKLVYNSRGWLPATSLYGSFYYYAGGFKVVRPAGMGSTVTPMITSCWYDESAGLPGAAYDIYAEWTDATNANHIYGPLSIITNLREDACYGLNQDDWDAIGQAWLHPETSNDFSAALLENGEFRVHMADGTLITPFWQIETRNGNIGQTNSATQILYDTLDRSISRTSISDGFSYTINDTQGNPKYYSLHYDNSHPAYNPHEHVWQNIIVLTSIDLPNGRSYTFEYGHDQGFLTKVTLPSGGYIAFDYYGGNSNHNLLDNYVEYRRVSVDGINELPPWHYVRTGTLVAPTVTVTDPEGHVVVHAFGYNGFEGETKWLETASSSPSKIVSIGFGVEGLPDTVITQMGSYSQKEVTTWTQESSLKYFVTEKTQSDWYTGSTEIPLTKTIYTPKSYSTEPIMDLYVQEIELQHWDGSTYVTVGKTQYEYDEGTLASVSGTVPHHQTPTFSRRNNLTTVRRYSGPSSYVEEHFSYDELGNVVDHEDIRGVHTSFDFTDNFSDSTNRYSYAYPKRVTVDPSGLGHHVATTVYNFYTGLPMSIADARNKVTTFTYDLMNRTDIISDPNGGSTDYTYDDVTPKVIETVLVASGKYRTTETTMDKLFRPIRSQLSDPAGDVFVDTEYYANGQVKKVSQPYRSGTAVFTQTNYDVLGRPLTVSDPDASETFITYFYEDNTVKQTDAAGNQRRYTSNALGQLTKVEEYKPDLAHALVTDYSYYVFGPLKQVTQYGSPGPLTRTFTSDWLGRTTSESHPESGTTSYTYDGNWVETRTDSRSTPITTAYGYDNIGRLSSVNYSDSTPDVTYTHDAAGYTGLLTSVAVSGVTSSSFTYDDGGQLLSEAVTRNGVSGTFTTAYTYDLGGRILTTTYPSGRVVTQTYAESGAVAGDRLASLMNGPTSTELVQSTQDNAAGMITNRTLSSGISEVRSFNPRNQLTRISAAANGSTLLDMGYGYGAGNTGKIRARTDAVQPEHSASYTFDDIGRLKEVSGGDSSWGITYTLDDYGNRTAQTPSGLASGSLGSPSFGYTYNKITGYTYDGAGNVLYDGTYHYYYDAENRINMVGDSSIQYAYDESGRRIKKLAGGVTTHYFYGLTGLMSEFSTSTSMSSASEASSSDRLQYRVGEQTGTAVMLIAADGIPRENNRVFPFGEPWNSNSGSDNSEKFTTYQRDGETGLDYAMARYYASRSGRFLSSDPGHIGASLGDPQSWNAYIYGRTDPVNLVDPSGKNYEVCIWGSERGCWDSEDEEYISLYESSTVGSNALTMPPPLAFPSSKDNGVLGYIYSDGGERGKVSYHFTNAQALGQEMALRADASIEMIEVGAAVGIAGGVAIAAAPIVYAGAQQLAFGPAAGRVMTQAGRVAAASTFGRLIGETRLGAAYNRVASLLPNSAVVEKGWSVLSRFWASGASGDVHIFPEARTATSVLWNVELPILYQNPLVRKIFH